MGKFAPSLIELSVLIQAIALGVHSLPPLPNLGVADDTDPVVPKLAGLPNFGFWILDFGFWIEKTTQMGSEAPEI